MFGLIVRKELRDIIGTTRFALTFAVVSLLILLSFYVGARGYQLSRDQYEAAVAQDLRQMEGQTDWLQIMPTIFLPPSPLASLVSGIANDIGRSIRVVGMGSLRARGTRYNEDPILAIARFLDLEFIFRVVLSLFAVLFAFEAISGEKERGTLALALSNSVPRDTFILGKFTGAFLGLSVPLLIPIGLGCLILIVMGIPLSGLEWCLLGMVVFAGGLYVGAFLGLSVLVSACTRRSSTSFLVLLVIWILSVLVLPRSAVLLAARSVDVPSVDEILSQRSRLLAQLWDEDRDEINEFFRSEEAETSSEDTVDRMADFNSFVQELNEERTAKLDALQARLEEKRQNQLAIQERLAYALARISPAAVFSVAALNLAGTGLDLPRHFLDQATAYQEVFERFQKQKTGRSSGGGVMIVAISATDTDQPKVIDPKELPPFDYQPPALGEVFRAAVLDLGLLALFNVLFFTAGFVAFLRYDAR